jgi:hypothetical protein
MKTVIAIGLAASLAAAARRRDELSAVALNVTLE